MEQAEGPQPICLIACPRLFLSDRIVRTMPEGLTVSNMMKEIGWERAQPHTRVFFDDRFIGEAEWESARPVAGQLVTMRLIPTGGNGQGKDAFRVVAMIGVVAASLALSFGAAAPLLGAGFAGGTLGATGLAAGTSIFGSLKINALIPSTNEEPA